MPSHRSLRIAEAVREVVAESILFDVSDPRVRSVTVLRCEVSFDLRQAVVFVSIMGTETEQRLAMRGLQHASGYLQAKVAKRLQTRTTPVLSFKHDDSVKKSIDMTRLIDEALAADRLRIAEAEGGAAVTGPIAADLDEDDGRDEDDDLEDSTHP